MKCSIFKYVRKAKKYKDEKVIPVSAIEKIEQDLIEICEDNEVIIDEIKGYFRGWNDDENQEED